MIRPKIGDGSTNDGQRLSIPRKGAKTQSVLTLAGTSPAESIEALRVSRSAMPVSLRLGAFA